MDGSEIDGNLDGMDDQIQHQLDTLSIVLLAAVSTEVVFLLVVFVTSVHASLRKPGGYILRLVAPVNLFLDGPSKPLAVLVMGFFSAGLITNIASVMAGEAQNVATQFLNVVVIFPFFLTARFARHSFPVCFASIILITVAIIISTTGLAVGLLGLSASRPKVESDLAAAYESSISNDMYAILFRYTVHAQVDWAQAYIFLSYIPWTIVQFVIYLVLHIYAFHHLCRSIKPLNATAEKMEKNRTLRMLFQSPIHNYFHYARMAVEKCDRTILQGRVRRKQLHLLTAGREEKWSKDEDVELIDAALHLLLRSGSHKVASLELKEPELGDVLKNGGDGKVALGSPVLDAIVTPLDDEKETLAAKDPAPIDDAIETEEGVELAVVEDEGEEESAKAAPNPETNRPPSSRIMKAAEKSASPQPQPQPTPRVTARLLSKTPKTDTDDPPPFEYSTRHLMCVLGCALVVYFVLLLCINVCLRCGLGLTELIAKSYVFSNANFPEVPEIAGTIRTIGPVIMEAVFGATVGGSVLAAVICWGFATYAVTVGPSRAYKEGILKLRRGEKWFDNDVLKKKSYYAISEAFTFVGYALGFTTGGVIFLMLLLMVLIVVVIVFVVIMIYVPGDVRKFAFDNIVPWVLKIVAPGIAISIALMIINKFVVARFFTADGRFRIIHPHFVSLLDVFTSVFSFFSGIVALISVLAIVLMKMSIRIVQYYRPLQGLERCDNDARYRRFAAAMYLDHVCNNPILRAFLVQVQVPLRLGPNAITIKSSALEYEDDFLAIASTLSTEVTVRTELRDKIAAARVALPASRPFTDKELRDAVNPPAPKEQKPKKSDEKLETEEQEEPSKAESKDEEKPVSAEMKELHMLHRRMCFQNRWFLAVTLMKYPELTALRKSKLMSKTSS